MFWKRGTKGLEPVVNIIFNGRNSDSTNWFTKERVTDILRGPNVKQNRKYNSWSATKPSRSHKRHFYINFNHSGCPRDVGLVAVIDG